MYLFIYIYSVYGILLCITLVGVIKSKSFYLFCIYYCILLVYYFINSVYIMVYYWYIILLIVYILWYILYNYCWSY